MNSFSQFSSIAGLAQFENSLYKFRMNIRYTGWGYTDWRAGPDGPKDSGPKDSGEGDSEGGEERGVATKVRPKTKKPSMWRVILMNDDYTPMEFVVSILMGIFKKTSEEATQIMLNVHQSGVGTCGVYTFEVAETKVAQVMDAAKRAQHPLQCTLEKE